MITQNKTGCSQISLSADGEYLTFCNTLLVDRQNFSRLDTLSRHFVSLQDNAVLIPRRKEHAIAKQLSRAVHQ